MIISEERKREIIEKIQACFRRADTTRGASQAEAETSIKMAKKLMLAYNLSQAEVDASESEETAAIDKIVEMGDLEHYADPAHYECELTMVCQHLFNVKPVRTHYFDKVSGKMRRKLVFYGYETDVVLAKSVFKILRDDIHALEKQLGKGVDLTTRLHYKRGIVHELIARAKEQVRDATAEELNKCTALMVVKDKAINDYIAKELGKLRQGRAYNHHDAAYAQGRTDGRKVSLNFGKRIE